MQAKKCTARSSTFHFARASQIWKSFYANVSKFSERKAYCLTKNRIKNNHFLFFIENGIFLVFKFSLLTSPFFHYFFGIRRSDTTDLGCAINTHIKDFDELVKMVFHLDHTKTTSWLVVLYFRLVSYGDEVG